MTPACDLTRCIPAGKVLADAPTTPTACMISSKQGGEPVIPPCRHRKYQHPYDRIPYKQRWGIEYFFATLEQWRRIATRYDKLAANFLGFVMKGLSPFVGMARRFELRQSKYGLIA